MGPKKQKQTMSLGNFLNDQALGSWADEMEDMPMPYSRGGFGGERRTFNAPLAGGFGDRGGFTERNYQPREQLPLPSAPPYTAHLGNLSFDVVSADIEDFFGEASKVTSVRLVEDKIDRKPKGFGYVEFETLDGLKNALDLNGTNFQGRSIKISVADPPKDRPQTRELNDWTRKGPLPDLPGQESRRTSMGPPRGGGYDLASEGRSTSRRGGAPYDGDKAPRDFGNWERRGPLSPVSPGPQQQQQGPPRDRPRAPRGDASFERRPSPAWGEGASREGSRPPRPAPERTPTAAEMDNQWRARMRPDAPTPTTQTPEASVPSSPAASQHPAPLASRPKLNLQKRTVSNVPDDAPTSATDSKASPFGAARPIDTATRDAEIAQKREETRLAKEAEDKAKADKAAAEGPQTAQQPQQGRKNSSRGGNAPPTPTRADSNQNGRPARGGRQNSRSGPPPNGGEGGDAPDAAAGPGETRDSRFAVLDEDAEDANGAIPGDKETKPKELVRPIGQADAQNAPDTASELAEEGWTEVAKPAKGGKHRRGASQGARAALAS